MDHGDEVILPVPYWVSFKDIIQYAGGKVVYLPTEEAENFRVTADAIERAITPRTKVIILNSPSNPSGSVVSSGDLERIVKLAMRAGSSCCWMSVRVPALRRYTGLRRFLVEAKEHVIVLGSLSKTYAMTGWRAGFALGPKPVIAAMSKLQSQSTSSTAAIVQKAAIAALSGSQACVTEMRADYLKLRDVILQGLQAIPGITCSKPEGAFYVYPNVSSFLGKPGANSTTELATRLLHEAHVVAVPGEAFGTRSTYACPTPSRKTTLKKAWTRMKKFFGNLS